MQTQPHVQAGRIQQLCIKRGDHLAFLTPGLDLPITQNRHPVSAKTNLTQLLSESSFQTHTRLFDASQSHLAPMAPASH